MLCIFLSAAGTALGAEPFQRKPTAHFVYEFHPQQEELVKRLDSLSEKLRTKQCAVIRPCFTGSVTVQIASDEQEFLDLQPYRSHIDWASGVAYEELDLIVLRVDAQMLLSIEETFEHELSHVLLLKAVKTRPPRWFIEGVALLLADRDLFQRFESVAAATVSDSTLELKDMDRTFPGQANLRELAYAQSGVFVAYLDNRFGPKLLPELITAMSYGMSLDRAFAKIAGLTLKSVEADWRDSLSNLGWAMSLTSDWIVWLAASLLFVVAVLLVRRRIRKRKDAMADSDGPDWEFRTGP